MRISDWSSDVCSSDLVALADHQPLGRATGAVHAAAFCSPAGAILCAREDVRRHNALDKLIGALARTGVDPARSEEHTSELQSLMRLSYAVFCLKPPNKRTFPRQPHYHPPAQPPHH